MKKYSIIGNFSSIIYSWNRVLAIFNIALTSLLLNYSYSACEHSHKSDNDLDIKVWFAPQDPCLDLIVAKILSAKTVILIHAYIITSNKIANALAEAHRNGIKVKLLIDKDAQTTKGSKVKWLLQQGIPVMIDKTVGYAHNKVMIIDDVYVITGSFNWTHNAQVRNAENLVVIKGSTINKKFKDNWYIRAAAGKPLVRSEYAA